MEENQGLILEQILEKTINVLVDSKKELFSIYETSREDLENHKNEIKVINMEMKDIISMIEEKRKENLKARMHLMEVSRDVKNNSEEEIKNAYRRAEKLSVEIAVLKEKEEQLQNRRSELEKRVNYLQSTVNKAENLVSRVGVVNNYLHGELDNLSTHFDDLREKRKVAMKIIQAQEEERKRIAREIHDGPAQSLVNLVFRFEIAAKLIDKDIEKAKVELSGLKDIVSKSVKDVRKTIYDLRPMSLDDLGLVPTLKRFIKKLQRETQIEIELDIKGEMKRLPDCYEITIFRLVQEGLNNIKKHAQADNAKVIMEYSKKQIHILIRDNGRGFNLDGVNGDKFGLVSMRERCDLLGGNFKIRSGPKIGTRIIINIPIKRGDNYGNYNQD